MKLRKIPMRTCVITKEKLPKEELIRIVRTKDGQILVDNSGKVNGKGAYLKKELTIIQKAKKTKVLNKYLEVEIPDIIFNELENLIK